MATGVTEEQEFSQTNNKDPVTAGLTHPLIADKQRQKHFINHRRTKQLRRAKYILDSTESEQQPFSYSFVDNSNAWTPEREREGEKTKTGKRQTRSTKKNTHTTNTDIKTTRGSSDWILLSAAALPDVRRAETERRSGAPIEVSGWLAASLGGGLEGGHVSPRINGSEIN